ncbi:Hypothetical predicted protein, partial [Pelobates cultripes]
MADLLPNKALDSLSEGEDFSNVPMLTPQQNNQALPHRQTEPQMATKVDLSGMVSDLKAFFTSELAVLKEELGTLTGRIRVTEDQVHDLRVKQDSTTKQVLEISTT